MKKTKTEFNLVLARGEDVLLSMYGIRKSTGVRKLAKDFMKTVSCNLAPVRAIVEKVTTERFEIPTGKGKARAVKTPLLHVGSRVRCIKTYAGEFPKGGCYEISPGVEGHVKFMTCGGNTVYVVLRHTDMLYNVPVSHLQVIPEEGPTKLSSARRRGTLENIKEVE